MSAEDKNAYLFTDRREGARTEVDLEAVGIIPGKDSALNCQIVDVSDTGAKVHLNDIDIVPHRIKMFVPETKILHECEIVWRSGKDIGVRFLNQVQF